MALSKDGSSFVDHASSATKRDAAADRAPGTGLTPQRLLLPTARHGVAALVLAAATLLTLLALKVGGPLTTAASFYHRGHTKTGAASWASAGEDSDIVARVDRILRTTPLFDGHDDLAYYLRWAHNNYVNLDNFTGPFEAGTLGGEVDLARLRSGRVGGTFWSVFADCPKESDGDGYTAEYLRKALATVEAAVDVIDRVHARYPKDFGRPLDSGDAMPIFRSGRIVSPLGLEGLHVLDPRYAFAGLRKFHERGVRYATLAHNCHNPYADPALVQLPAAEGGGIGPAPPRWGGVSMAGRKVIREMNRLGVLVDLSHTSADTMRDVLGGHHHDGNNSSDKEEEEDWHGSLAPPIFSHSSAFALCPHPRNVPDDVISLVAARGGIIMVTFTPEFVSCHWPDGHPREGRLPETYGPNLTVSQVVRHMRHIADLVGSYDNVGIGSDFDGVASTIPGLDDVSRFPALAAEMLRQGISDGDAAKIVGGNLLRVWDAADAVARRLRREGVRPAEDELPWLGNPWGLA